MTYSIPNQKKRGFLSWTALFAVFFVPTVLFVFWRCPYGFGNIDESFYLTIPYRLLQGDALLQEEWHLSQMAGVLTMPLVSAYLKLNGSTEGILLAMRYVCTAVQCICAVFLYIRLKRMSPLGAILASVSFLLYTPFNIMALSYNSMGILCLTVSLVIILTAENKLALQYCAAGLFFAAAVLCCPYLLGVYIVYLAAVAVMLILRKWKPDLLSDTPLTVKRAVWFTSGAAFAAVLFVGFVLSRGSLQGIIAAFKPMFNDPEHPPISLLDQTVSFFWCIFFANDRTPVLYLVLMGLAGVCLLIRKKPQYKLPVFCLIAATVVMLQLSIFKKNHYINQLMWSANVLAGFVFLLTANPKIYRLFFTVWLPGMMYAFCLNLTSNQMFYAISSASSVATLASIVIICMYGEELLQAEGMRLGKCAAIVLIGTFLATQLCTQTILRYQFVFWDSGINNMTAQMTDGIEKGLYTTENNKASYDEKLRYLDQLSAYKGENVLYLSENTWYYLQNENRSSAYSAWLSGVNDASLDRLEIYYQINPRKLPVAVFADAGYEKEAVSFSQRFGYTLQTVDGGFLLLPE